MKNSYVWKTIMCSAFLLVGSMANAALIVSEGNFNQDTDNVLSNSCDGNVTGPALTVQGCFNTNNTFFVNFTSDENLLISGGQAAIEAFDGAFSYMEIALADEDYIFEKLVLNIDASAAGLITFTGIPGGTSDPFALVSGGANFFTITGESFSSISFVTTVGIASVDLVSDLAQVRMGGVLIGNPSAVPEPGTLSILGLGLLGIGLVSRRKQSSN